MNAVASIWHSIAGAFTGENRIKPGDIGNWLFELLVLPGNALVYVLNRFVPAVAEFVHLGADARSGPLVIIISAVVWLLAIVITGTVLTGVFDFFRRLIDQVTGVFRELQRLWRVIRRRVVAYFGYRSAKRAAAESELEVAAIQLAATETKVLRCLSNIDDNAVMTLDEISASLGRDRRDIKALVQRLIDLQLIEAGADKIRRRNGLKIATAGQMFLLGA